MKLLKKTIASIALVTLVSSLFTTGAFAYSEAEKTAADSLAAKGIIVAKADAAGYNLDQNVLRQEIAAVARWAAEVAKKTTCAGSFKDVTATTPNNWACYSVEALLDAWLIAANENFRPEANITKAEAVGMMVKAAYGTEYAYNNALGTTWQEQVVAFAVSKGIITSFTNYEALATRGFVFEVGASAIDGWSDDLGWLLDDLLGEDEEDDTTSTWTTDDTTVVTGGDLEISLSPDTPAAQSIPRTAESVNYLSFEITAGDEDATINSVKLTRKWLGSRTDFGKIRLVRDGLTVSNDKTIASDDTVTLTTKIVIKAGSTETLSVVAEMDSAGNTVNYFEVTDIDTDWTVTGAPVAGNPMTTVDYTVAELTVDAKGTDTTIDVWSEGTTIWEFKLSETEWASKKWVVLKSIRLKSTWGVDLEENLLNIALYENGTKVSTETVVDGDYVAFALDDLVIADGKSKTFVIKADIDNWENGDTITFSVKDSFDIYALEEGTGIGATIDNTTDWVLADYTLNAGKVTLSQDTTTPSNEEYVKDTDDVLLFVAKVDTDQDISVDTIKVFVHADSTDLTKAQHEARYENVKLVVNDTTIDSTDTVTDAGAANIGDGSDYYEFDSSVTLKDNDLIKVYVDVTSTAVTWNVLKFALNNAGTSAGNSASLLDVEYLSDGETVPQAKLSGTASSNKLTLVDSSAWVTIIRNDGYNAGEVFLAGEQWAVLMRWVINSANSSSLEINKMNFDLDVTTSSYSNYTNFKLLIGGTQHGTSEDFAQVWATVDGTLTIEDINYIIAKNKQVTFELVGNVDTSTVADNAVVTLDTSDSLFYDDADNEVLIDNNGNGTWNEVADDVSSPSLTINENAKLTIAVDGNTPDEAIVVADSTNVEVAKYKFTANDGDVAIKDLYYAWVSDDSRISSLKLVVNGSIIDSRIPSGGKTHFELGSSNKIIVKKNTSVVVSVKADFNKITNDSQTNKTVALELTDLVAETNATGKALTKVENAELVAWDDVDDTVVTLDTGDHYTTSEVEWELNIIWDTMYIRKTIPTLTTQGLSTSKISNWAQQTIYKMTVSADSKADVEVAQLLFNVNSSALTTVDWYKLFINGTEVEVADLGNGDAILDAWAFEWDDVPEFRFVDGQEIVVWAGSSKTFELKATVTNGANDDYVTVNLLEDTYQAAAFADTKASAVGAASANFIWSDNAGSPHSSTTNDWFNSYKVVGLDTTSTTIEE